VPVCLSDAKARNAKPKARPYKMSDGEGLFLLVMPSGSKYWRLRYFFAGKEKSLALGVYPEVSLIEARSRQDQAKKAVAGGTDPGELKKEVKRTQLLKSGNSFEAIGREWFEHRRHEWSESTYTTKQTRLERFIFPKLGSRPIAEITAPEVLQMLRSLEKAGILDTAHRIKQMCSQVFMYAIATGRAERNPVNDLRGAIKTPVVRHWSYLTERDLPDFLQKLESFKCNYQTKLALRFLLLTFVRSTELRAARWSEINWGKKEWRIPAERMKMKELHIVPLSTQAISLLRDLQDLNGQLEYLFPNHLDPKKCMSENTVLYALYRMGYHSKATGHGFRSTASTILNEHGFRADVIERQLAHTEQNAVRAAYNHAQYLPERREMMQWWADYLDGVGSKS
jgi:integrase